VGLLSRSGPRRAPPSGGSRGVAEPASRLNRVASDSSDPVLFTLIYEGSMTPNAKAPEVHRIREQLHVQLRELWTYAPLSEARA
jgi:hypothetical protein